jgi:phosphate transporter
MKHEKVTLYSLYSRYRKYISVVIACAAFAAIMHRRPMGSETLTGNETFALLVFCIIMWIANPVPVYVTALLAPVLAVWLRVLVQEGDGRVRLERKDAGELVLKFMTNRIVTVALGGFVLARALNKALSGSSRFADMFRKAASNGKCFSWFLLALVLAPMYLAALIPQEASVVIIFNLVAPVIYALPADSAVAKVSLLALMLGGNLGGMLSSISTPQNILLFSSARETGSDKGHFNLTFLVWAKVSLPVTFVAAIGIWIGLLLIWKPWRFDGLTSDVKLIDAEAAATTTQQQQPINTESTQSISSATASSCPTIKQLNAAESPDGVTKNPQLQLSKAMKFWILLVGLATVFLWLSARYLQNTFGGLGVVSLVPIVALFGSGVLDKDDLHALPWDVVLLAMGATTLSAICKNSGLFDLLEREFEVLLRPLGDYHRIVMLCALMTVSSAVKSRYIAALVYLPLAFRAIGSTSSADTAGLIVGQKILVAFACSAGMLLPISGLVNAFIVQVKSSSSPDGEKYISSFELTVAGALGTAVSLVSIISVGYLMIHYI